MTSNIFIKHYSERIDENGRKLVSEFFITFSRFECALKATVVFANGNDRRVEPNWDRFIASIRENFDKGKNESLQNAVEYLLESPPRVQSLIDNQISWRVRDFQDNTPEVNKLKQHIADIRNNLFHGGKFNGKFQPAISRNYKLIDSAMIVLNEWLSLSEEVRTEFLKEMG